MNTISVKDQEIVRALSVVKVPEDVLRQIDIRGVVEALATSSENVQKYSSDLEQARKEKKEGYILVNWLKGRGTKVEDLQYALQHSIGELTTTTTQLLIFNTAISRELSKQQEVLVSQQRQLKEQTQIIEQQNKEILAQQKALEQQQKEINAANQGLLEAKGVTAEQAKKLIGCVQRVEVAESKVDESNRRLAEDIAAKISGVSAEVASSLADSSKKIEDQFLHITKEVSDQIADLRDDSVVQYGKFTKNLTALSQELYSRMEAYASGTDVAIRENVNSVKRDLENTTKTLSESMHKKCSSLSDTIEALNQVQSTDRVHYENLLSEQIAQIKNEFGRRERTHFVAIVFLFVIAIATGSMQIMDYIHH